MRPRFNQAAKLSRTAAGPYGITTYAVKEMVDINKGELKSLFLNICQNNGVLSDWNEGYIIKVH